MPDDEDLVMESQEPSIEPPVKDLEPWLDRQADQLGTPTWWEELKAIPGITDLHRFVPEDLGILPCTRNPVSGIS